MLVAERYSIAVACEHVECVDKRGLAVSPCVDRQERALLANVATQGIANCTLREGDDLFVVGKDPIKKFCPIRALCGGIERRAYLPISTIAPTYPLSLFRAVRKVC